MDRLERATRLKAMLSQIAPGGEIESILPFYLAFNPPKPQVSGGLEGLEAMEEPTQSRDGSSALRRGAPSGRRAHSEWLAETLGALTRRSRWTKHRSHRLPGPR